MIVLVVSLIIKETRVKTTMNCNYTLTRMTENDGPSCTHRPKAAGTQPAQANQNSSMEGGGSHEFLPVTEERQRVMASGRGRIRFLYGCVS